MRGQATRQVSILEAKTHLSELIREAHEREVVITNRGKPVARLVPLGLARRGRVCGEARPAFEASGLTWEQIQAALAPMTEEELAAEGWPT